jgi:hypothetical protein
MSAACATFGVRARWGKLRRRRGPLRRRMALVF